MAPTCCSSSPIAFVHAFSPAVSVYGAAQSHIHGSALLPRSPPSASVTILPPFEQRPFSQRPRRLTVRQTVTQPPTPSGATSSSSEGGSGYVDGGGSGETKTDVLVIGAGVSGTSLAFNLHKHFGDTRVILTESRAVVGGNVISRQEGGYTWEEGPNTFQPAEHIMRLLVDVGLKDDLVLADHTLPRFVYWDKKLFALPLGPKDIPTFRLLSPWGAVRAGLGAMGFVWPYFGKDETVKQFITRHLGAEVFEKMIDPFVSGVYAGDPNKLCMSAAVKKIFALQGLGGTQGIIEGAIIRISQRRRDAKAKPMDADLPIWKPGALGSFRNGLSMLPAAVAAKLEAESQTEEPVRLEWTLQNVEKLPSGEYRASYNTPAGQRSIIAKAVAITAPARAAAGILAGVAPGVKSLEDIHYPTVWSITLGYPTDEFRMPLKGFGNLIPRAMGIRTLGTIWSSALFPGRAPEGMELLLSYIGGAQDPGIRELTEEEVVNIVDGDIKNILLKEGSSVKPVVVGARKWDRAIPQYDVGYWEIMERVEESMQKGACDGVFLGGNYTSGVAFGDCVLWGTESAPKIAEYVKSFKPVVTAVNDRGKSGDVGE